MTEKRFQYNVNKNTIEQDGKFVAYMNSVDGVRIANKLNVFQKENEQLKSRVDYLGRKIERERNSTHKQYAKWEKEAEDKIKELSEENGQLKKQNDNLVHMIARVQYRADLIKEENEQLKQQLSNIDGQLVMLDKCDNWDYDRMKHTVREIAKIIGYNGTINPKKVMCNDRIN